jgi:hypothetical protein
VVLPSVYRSSEFPDFANTVAWWTAALVLGILTIAAGLLILFGAGVGLAIVGVLFFLATAVAVGAGRFELSVALAGAGFLWTTAGIAVSLGTFVHILWVPAGFLTLGLLISLVALRSRILSVRREAPSLREAP